MFFKNKQSIIRVAIRYLSDKGRFLEDEFRGLNGISECVGKSMSGPEPVYSKLNPNMYKIFKSKSKFQMKSGGVLPEVQIAYETWGKLSPEKDNAILLFTGLSANSHAKRNAVGIIF